MYEGESGGGLESVSLSEFWSPWRQINSSNVASIRYNPATSTLQVAFTNGRKYEYDDVEHRTWERFYDGKFFYHVIKQGGYIFREL